MRTAVGGFLISVGIAFSATAASAGQLVYTPVNPTFGGNPTNGQFLLSTAQAQGAGTQAGPSVNINIPPNLTTPSTGSSSTTNSMMMNGNPLGNMSQ